MGSRKRSRPESKGNTPLQEGCETPAREAPPEIESHESHNNTLISLESAQKRTKTKDPDTLSITSRSTFTGATWPRIRKASPSTQIARESILADKPRNKASAADLSRFKPKKVDTSNPVAAPYPDAGPNSQNSKLAKNSVKEQDDSSQETDKNEQEDIPRTAGGSAKLLGDASGRPVAASGWLDWFGGSGALQKDPSEAPPPFALVRNSVADPRKPNDHAVASVPPKGQANLQAQPDASSISKAERVVEPKFPTSSWSGIWPSSTTGTPNIYDVPSKNNDGESSASSANSAEIPIQTNSIAPAAGSTWAFWSKDSRKSVERGGNQQGSGQIAITGGPSQDNPAPAHIATTIRDDKVEAGREAARGRQSLSDAHEFAVKSTSGEASNKTPAPKPPTNTPSDSSKKPTLHQSPAPSKAGPANIILPSFTGTYSLAESPSIMQKIARLLLQNQQTTANHIHLVKEPPKIKKALAIGIHGLFPAAFFRTVIGQPTGTSIRFANHAAAAIHRWSSSHGHLCEVEKVALEGEGKITDRVDNLWKLLLNWIDHVRKADFILVACHSQGVPVAVMLVAKLIDFGVVTSTRIGICAMAGVSMGPFADYKSRLFSGSAAELFEFGNPNSEVSKRYDNSLQVALRYGVRISYVGSIDDQLVSLESAVFSPVSHPYIYRAVFIDGRVHAPDFISHLVGFALKLRNLGISDHGLIRELSVPLAGSLYTGEGHSRLYDETRVYDLSISFALETTSVGDIPPRVENFDVSTSPNPFQLPWSMRGLLEEDIIKNELGQETAELLKQFDEWKPTTKVLKDVKYRLEAVKSKL